MSRWTIYIVVAAIFTVIFVGFSLTRSAYYTVSGEIDPDESGDIQNVPISYDVRFASLPRLRIENFGGGTVTYTISSKTIDGFVLSINSSAPGAKLIWIAEGAPVPSTDPRVIIQRWNLGQKLSALAFFLSLMGPLAEVLGLFGSAKTGLAAESAAEIGK